jgi:hypothetical protein
MRSRYIGNSHVESRQSMYLCLCSEQAFSILVRTNSCINKRITAAFFPNQRPNHLSRSPYQWLSLFYRLSTDYLSGQGFTPKSGLPTRACQSSTRTVQSQVAYLRVLAQRVAKSSDSPESQLLSPKANHRSVSLPLMSFLVLGFIYHRDAKEFR